MLRRTALLPRMFCDWLIRSFSPIEPSICVGLAAAGPDFGRAPNSAHQLYIFLITTTSNSGQHNYFLLALLSRLVLFPLRRPLGKVTNILEPLRSVLASIGDGFCSTG